MIRFLNIKTAYGVALIIAAASGSVVANANVAHAATRAVAKKPVVAKKPTVAKPAVANPTGAKSPVVAAKPNPVTLTSDAKIERVVVGADGKETIQLKNPKDVVVVPGDKVVFTLSYANLGSQPADGFRATNPMPGPVQFIEAAQDWAEVSVDNGVTWGKLTALKAKTAAPVAGGAPVERAATAADVTHVRWVFANPIAPNAKGTLSYRGVIK